MRRIRYFIEKLESGNSVDAIQVGNDSSEYSPHPVPVVLDGHHRLIAYRYLRRRRALVSYTGCPKLYQYLIGSVPSYPAK